jgi:hypothetical protein
MATIFMDETIAFRLDDSMKKFIRQIRKIKLRGILDLLHFVFRLILVLPLLLILAGLWLLIVIDPLARFVWGVLTEFEDEL